MYEIVLYIIIYNVVYLIEVFFRCEGIWSFILRWIYWLEKYCMERVFEKFL